MSGVILRRDRKKESLEAHFKIWQWLSNLPEYRRDYKLWHEQITKSTLTESKKNIWKSKWGFYPLFDPYSDTNFSEFEKYIDQTYRDGFCSPAIQITNYSMAEVKRRQFLRKWYKNNPEKCKFKKVKLSKLPLKLEIIINLKESIDLINDELREIVQNIKKEYNFPQRRASVDPELKFKASLLKRIGYPHSKIKTYLIPKKFQSPSHRAAFIRKLGRVLDKIS